MIDDVEARIRAHQERISREESPRKSSIRPPRSKPIAEGLTPRQAAVLAVIDRFWNEHDRSRMPDYRTLCAELGIHLNAIAGHLKALRRKKFLSIEAKTTRAMRILRRRDGNRVLIAGHWYEFIPAAQLEAPCTGNATAI